MTDATRKRQRLKESFELGPVLACLDQSNFHAGCSFAPRVPHYNGHADSATAGKYEIEIYVWPEGLTSGCRHCPCKNRIHDGYYYENYGCYGLDGSRMRVKKTKKMHDGGLVMNVC